MNDLLYTQGQDNLAGLVGEMYDCPVEDILSLPALTSAASLKTAVANIVNKSLKKFTRIYCTDETAKIVTKSVGERDGKGRESVLSFRYPKIGVELSDFISDRQNTPSVILYRLANGGKLYVLGIARLDKTSTVLSTAIPAYFESGDSDSGEKRADQNGVLFSFKFACAHDPIEYAGIVPLDPGA